MKNKSINRINLAIIFVASALIFIFLKSGGGNFSRQIIIVIGFSLILGSYYNYIKIAKVNLGNVSLILDPGFVFASIMLLYVFSPGLILFFELEEFTPIGWNWLTDFELVIAFFKFIFFFSAFTLFVSVRYKKIEIDQRLTFSSITDNIMAIFIVTIYAFSLLTTELLAAPVSNYYEFYTRHNHLTGITKIIVLFAKRLYWGLLPLLVFYLAKIFKGKFIYYFLIVLFLCAIDLYNSHGSRINTLLIVLQALMSYCFVNRGKIKINKLFAILLVTAACMTLIEVIRINDNSDVLSNNVNSILKLPGELIALYYPSVHISALQNTVVQISPIIVIEDILKLIPFLGIEDNGLMSWYWKNYHPNSIVAPYTMGIFANAAVLGDLWLLIECFIIAAILKYTRDILSMKKELFVLVSIYLSSVSVLAMKYGFYAYFDLLLKNLLPVLFLNAIIINILNNYKQRKFDKLTSNNN